MFFCNKEINFCMRKYTMNNNKRLFLYFTYVDNCCLIGFCIIIKNNNCLLIVYKNEYKKRQLL